MHWKNTNIPELLHSQNRRAWLGVWVDQSTEQMENRFRINKCYSLWKNSKLITYQKILRLQIPMADSWYSMDIRQSPKDLDITSQLNHYKISKEKVRNKNNISNQIANRENLILDMYIISHRLGAFSVSCYCSAL